MRISVAGLWHLGTVTAACCASSGHEVVAFDDDPATIANLRESRVPVEEPGLADLVRSEMSAARLRFTNDPSEISDAEILWIAYDTPVNENDIADTEFVQSRITRLVPYLKPGAIVLISSQMPVGSTATLAQSRTDLTFAYSPENLRLGKALETFLKPDRVVIGVRDESNRDRLTDLFAPFTTNLEWMSIESAEMTKHALNAFLATSVAFINEVASICELTGADAQEVERGLKTDLRIGRRAYLHPGDAFAGGTLARDVRFLLELAKQKTTPAYLLQGVLESNSSHKLWIRRRIGELLQDMQGKTIAILGLTYKPGTNTLRRSAAVELCYWLNQHGAIVQAFDPAIRDLTSDAANKIVLAESAEMALRGADAAVIATPWPEFQTIPPALFNREMRGAVVLDPGRHLEKQLRKESEIKYFAIGVSHEVGR
ncbi:MAG: UDP-glucose/GDP-mannose dehydrogenase family protein [Acidobacteriaceae bacterium]|nr:UDP-glucose/GDP-mannose dehydrogenase family protein [Acidobacteriaceae bacterium]MBV9302602.1 UDP-glucose/GDP-mannose dehydrogenase family protein [Acidobacteriaceae bacterium]MBV9767819.1 UDP-glucose/GDP-mannose dehydrogenase family protein [Acidobacteriaceae bacterium]